MLYSVFGARKLIGQPTAHVVVANSHASVQLDVWICISVLLQIEYPIYGVRIALRAQKKFPSALSMFYCFRLNRFMRILSFLFTDFRL